MTYRFIYNQAECNRVIPAVLIDARSSKSIKNQIGSVIKQFTDEQVSMITDECIFYKIETNTGNLAGYFTLKVSGTSVALFQFETRSSFVQFNNTISGQIVNFISSGDWKFDYL